jgi:hypothetical protein
MISHITGRTQAVCVLNRMLGKISGPEEEEEVRGGWKKPAQQGPSQCAFLTKY